MTVAAHARALARWRRGLAILLLENLGKAVTVRDLGRTSAEPLGIFDAAVDAMLAGRATFDVSAARGLATDLIALEDEHVAFTDWTVARGKGPDNREPGAHVESCPACRGCRVLANIDGALVPAGVWSGYVLRYRTDGTAAWSIGEGQAVECTCYGRLPAGGWPGKLAREWGTVPCGACNGTRSRLVQDPMTDGLSTTRLWCSDCKGTGRQPKPGADRRAPQGRSLARVGRRLLEALKGQPDECQAITPCPYIDGPRKRSPPCDCHGTGHNLRGYLPEVDVTPAMRWRVADSCEAGTDMEIARHPKWFDGLDIGVGLGEFPVTRVGPRGAHTVTLGQEPWEPAGSPRVHMYTPWGQETEYPKRFKVRDLAPRWRRGELLHAQQRRERAEAVEYALEFVAPEASA